MHEPKLHRVTGCRMFVPGLLVLLAGLMNPDCGQAETGDQPALYDVEVVVFRNRSPQPDGEQLTLRSADADREPGAGFLSKPVDSGIEELSPGQRSLKNIADALQRSGAYDVVLHTAWRQVGLDRTLAMPYTVPGGSGRSGYRLEGTIRLVRERFLHLDINLLLSQPPGALASAAPGPVYELQETRRVRRRELHYFDHPGLGVIAKVVPYAAPEPAELPIPVGTVRMEGSDPSVVGDAPTPGTPQDNAAPESLPATAAPPINR